MGCALPAVDRAWAYSLCCRASTFMTRQPSAAHCKFNRLGHIWYAMRHASAFTVWQRTGSTGQNDSWSNLYLVDRGCSTNYFPIDWLIEQGLTSHQTHCRSYRGRFLQVIWPNQRCQSTEGNYFPKTVIWIRCSDREQNWMIWFLCYFARVTHSSLTSKAQSHVYKSPIIWGCQLNT